MADLFDDPIVSIGFGVLILCGLCALAYYAVSRFRDYTDDDYDNTDELLANLKEMHLKGDITDEEYRTINEVSQTHEVCDAGEPESGSTESESEQITSPD